MKRFGLLGWAAMILIAGCGANNNGPKSETQLIQTPTEPIATPNLKETSSLRMVEGGRVLRVGDDVSEETLLFPRPERRAVAFRDLPPGFGEDYQSKGWETDAEGFGVITLGGKLVVAVRSEMGVDEARLQQILRKYQLALDTAFAADVDIKKPAMQISWARYWFVEDPPHRLMICAVRPKSDVLNITEALGWDEAMNALRMSKAKANHDLKKAMGSRDGG